MGPTTTIQGFGLFIYIKNKGLWALWWSEKEYSGHRSRQRLRFETQDCNLVMEMGFENLGKLLRDK